LEMSESGALDVEIEARVKEILKRSLRPELLNRIDEVVTFHQLTRKDLAGIVEIQLKGLRRRLAERGLSIEIAPAAVNALANEGYDPQFGARPLKRVIQQRLENPLAARLLSGQFNPGDTIEVDYQREQFVFERSPGPVEAEVV
ncbi:MAG: type VI secretion system ATPase TssH, partial [Myxococcales bacterium]|nr:type VI secretion system ATPase TssH [Myxococcales bacterium]